jgi:energy-converting hydrogenase Eha subunit F
MSKLTAWLQALWRTCWPRPRPPPSARQRAQDLIAAVDAGGLPLNPARVNDIARQLGLEVSTSAPLDKTIARIRAALKYQEL